MDVPSFSDPAATRRRWWISIDAANLVVPRHPIRQDVIDACSPHCAVPPAVKQPRTALPQEVGVGTLRHRNNDAGTIGRVPHVSFWFSLIGPRVWVPHPSRFSKGGLRQCPNLRVPDLT